jgi:hypothetical protein
MARMTCSTVPCTIQGGCTLQYACSICSSLVCMHACAVLALLALVNACYVYACMQVTYVSACKHNISHADTPASPSSLAGAI